MHVDLATVRDTATVDAEEPVDLAALPWPESGWAERVAASPLLTAGEASPLRLEGTRLYLDRYWREERHVADDLAALGAHAPRIDEPRLADGLARLFPDAGRQRGRRGGRGPARPHGVAGGPGTGKTTTVARIVALLDEQAAAADRALAAAPTGKAAARLEEAVHAEAEHARRRAGRSASGCAR